MAKALKNKELSRDIAKIVPLFFDFKRKQLILDYDQEADVMYFSFKYPQQATESELLDNNIIANYRKNELVGLTVLNARQKFGK